MKPIIMSTEDVRALLDGRKTMARQVVKPQPYYFYNCVQGEPKPVRGERLGAVMPDKTDAWITSPYKPGDVLWVREKFNFDEAGEYLYAADEDFIQFGIKRVGDFYYSESEIKWRPSIHMPREAARLFLRVTDVRVERVQDISEKDAKAEGVYAKDNGSGSAYRSGYRELWNKLNKKRGHDWYTNDWVWVIEFERIEKGGKS